MAGSFLAHVLKLFAASCAGHAASRQGSGTRGGSKPVEADEDPLLGGCAGGNHPPAARVLHRPERGGKQRALNLGGEAPQMFFYRGLWRLWQSMSVKQLVSRMKTRNLDSALPCSRPWKSISCPNLEPSGSSFFFFRLHKRSMFPIESLFMHEFASRSIRAIKRKKSLVKQPSSFLHTHTHRWKDGGGQVLQLQAPLHWWRRSYPSCEAGRGTLKLR